MDALVQSGLKSGLFYGAEVLVAQGAKVQLHRAYGTFDGARPLTKDAIFDVASLTKPVAIASLLLRLGLPLESKVSAYLPRFTGGGKEAVTLRHLAAHLSGLPPTVRFIETCTTPEDTLIALLAVPLESAAGQRVAYSCLGYMLLGKVIEAATGQALDRLFRDLIATPSGMADSGFLPLQNGIAPQRIVPSGRRAAGVVHDSNAWLMGGVSGNAGLFTTARDLHRFAMALLPMPTSAMFANQSPHGAVPRTIGFELQTPDHSASCGPGFPHGAVGHTGFTGTSLWIALQSEAAVIILSNRSAISHRGTLADMANFRHRMHEQSGSLAATAIDLHKARGPLPSA